MYALVTLESSSTARKVGDYINFRSSLPPFDSSTVRSHSPAPPKDKQQVPKIPFVIGRDKFALPRTVSLVPAPVVLYTCVVSVATLCREYMVATLLYTMVSLLRIRGLVILWIGPTVTAQPRKWVAQGPQTCTFVHIKYA
jgi:hypothetical protein